MAISSWCYLKPLPLPPPIYSDSKFSCGSSSPARTILVLRIEPNDEKLCRRRSPTAPPQSKAIETTTSFITGNLIFGVACAAVIGFEIINPATTMAMTSHITKSSSLPSTAATLEFSSTNTKGGASARWSQKRKCPPWNNNTLYETIVPENLPRPSAHRRWEKIGYGGSSSSSDDHHHQGRSSPSVNDSSSSVNGTRVVIRTKMGCFSM